MESWRAAFKREGIEDEAIHPRETASLKPQIPVSWFMLPPPSNSQVYSRFLHFPQLNLHHLLKWKPTSRFANVFLLQLYRLHWSKVKRKQKLLFYWSRSRNKFQIHAVNRESAQSLLVTLIRFIVVHPRSARMAASLWTLQSWILIGPDCLTTMKWRLPRVTGCRMLALMKQTIMEL